MASHKKLTEPKWTLVQHSAYGYQAKPGWDHAVETRQIGTEVELERVKSVDGYVFDSYAEADDQEMKSNYPDGAGDTLTYPYCKGTFSHKEIDGLKIYIPLMTKIVVG